MSDHLESATQQLNNPAIQWAKDTLAVLDYTLKSDTPEVVIQAPWSWVGRFDTDKGYMYLKQMPKLIALESQVTQILSDKFSVQVPQVLADNDDLHCFLMKDVGRPLRETLRQYFDVHLLCKAVDQFASMQQAVANHVDLFLEIGVPDWRLDQLPDLYNQLLLEKDILMQDGLSNEELESLKSKQDAVVKLCQRLSSDLIKPSLVQCDFHDNNIMIDEKTQTLSFIDLGEVVISHPFFSLIGLLDQINRHHGITQDDTSYQAIMKTYMSHFMKGESEQQLKTAFAEASILWIIYEALAQYRLRLACDEKLFINAQRKGKLADALKLFLVNVS